MSHKKTSAAPVSPLAPPSPPTATAEDTLPLSFQSDESSSVQGASYDLDTEILCITFRYADAPTYQYDKFPRVMWQEFLEAPSKGRYFQSRIRPVFSGKKVG